MPIQGKPNHRKITQNGKTMATKTQTITTRTSDLSDAELSQDAPRVKLTLTVDGTVERIELDVTPDELSTLRVALKPYFDAVEIAKGNVPTGSGDAAANQRMRQWAISTAEKAGGKYVFNGETLETPNARGRLSQQWKDAYSAAHTATDEGHASVATIDAAIAAGEESVKAVKGK
jgi:hypothetical protein